jgi:hypothetical protein
MADLAVNDLAAFGGLVEAARAALPATAAPATTAGAKTTTRPTA